MSEMPYRFQRYASWSDPWLLALGVVFLAAWSVSVVRRDVLSAQAHDALFAVMLVVWIAFIVDIGVRATLSYQPVRYLLKHPIDLLVVFVPPAQPLKLLTVFASAPALATRRGRGRGVIAVFAAIFLVTWAGATAMFAVERDAPDANILTFGEALWWAPVTMFTVGYGDQYPVTPLGRMIAILVMVTGVALIGVVTASVASWFITANRMASRFGASAGEIELRGRIDVLEAKIDTLLSQSGVDHAMPAEGRPADPVEATRPSE